MVSRNHPVIVEIRKKMAIIDKEQEENKMILTLIERGRLKAEDFQGLEERQVELEAENARLIAKACEIMMPAKF